MASPDRRVRKFAPVLGLATAALAFGAGSVGLGATAASAATQSSTIPTIGNASKLSVEPVVHADHAKPPTTLKTKDLVVGTGAVVTSGSTVDVMYVGADYTNGKDFTSATWKSNEATSFNLHTVVKGFAEGLVGMKVGGRREIVIPPSLGYGDQAEGPIKANETLVFVVDLKSVTP